MAEYNIYQDISKRSGGDVYIGVVGPVRTGKSTFIKKFMELNESSIPFLFYNEKSTRIAPCAFFFQSFRQRSTAS